jgi:predicted O-methyltransferase YrrM
MQEFVRDWIIPLAEKHGWRSFCEIGASTGLSSDELLKLPNITHTIVDPCLDMDLALKFAGDARVTVKKGNSLDVLPNLTGAYDCILIDGDHNWYTVFNELRLIRELALLPPGGTIFFHDVGWPYGRRDMYYQPDTIPPEYRLEYARKNIVRGQRQLVDSAGKNQHLNNAVHEGGPRNGVLTAIEDFVAEHPTEYHFCRVWHQFGLGILQYRTRKGSDDLSFLVLRVKVGIYNFPRLVRLSLRQVVWAFQGLVRKANR